VWVSFSSETTTISTIFRAKWGQYAAKESFSIGNRLAI
jgi:hypothetical protein